MSIIGASMLCPGSCHRYIVCCCTKHCLSTLLLHGAFFPMDLEQDHRTAPMAVILARSWRLQYRVVLTQSWLPEVIGTSAHRATCRTWLVNLQGIFNDQFHVNLIFERPHRQRAFSYTYTCTAHQQTALLCNCTCTRGDTL